MFILFSKQKTYLISNSDKFPLLLPRVFISPFVESLLSCSSISELLVFLTWECVYSSPHPLYYSLHLTQQHFMPQNLQYMNQNSRSTRRITCISKIWSYDYEGNLQVSRKWKRLIFGKENDKILQRKVRGIFKSPNCEYNYVTGASFNVAWGKNVHFGRKLSKLKPQMKQMQPNLL